MGAQQETSFARYVVAAAAVPGMLQLACMLIDQIGSKSEECKQRLRKEYGADPANEENVRGVWQDVDRLIGTADIALLDIQERCETILQYSHDYLLTGAIVWPKEPAPWEGQSAVSFLGKLAEMLKLLEDIDMTIQEHLNFLRELEDTLEGKNGNA